MLFYFSGVSVSYLVGRCSKLFPRVYKEGASMSWHRRVYSLDTHHLWDGQHQVWDDFQRECICESCPRMCLVRQGMAHAKKLDCACHVWRRPIYLDRYFLQAGFRYKEPICMRFEVPVGVRIKFTDLWNVISYTSVDRYQRFGENCCFHDFFAEGRGTSFLRNVGTYPPNDMTSDPTRKINVRDPRLFWPCELTTKLMADIKSCVFTTNLQDMLV
jgi:hypothetical protein